MSKTLPRLAAALPLIAFVALAGCSSDAERALGLTRDVPDEFTVTTRAPLSLPPDFTPKPPVAGEARPQELTPQQAAEATLAPGTALGGTAGPATPGQDALVSQAGPAAPADIRDTVNGEAKLDRPAEGLTERLMFWRDSGPAGTLLDPGAESQRLRENAALGQPLTAGATPIIQDPNKKPSSGGFLGIF
jgi:hypothetical protein